MIAKVMRRKRVHANLDNPGDRIFVSVRMMANDKPRHPGFEAGRAKMKIMKTRFRVGS